MLLSAHDLTWLYEDDTGPTETDLSFNLITKVSLRRLGGSGPPLLLVTFHLDDGKQVAIRMQPDAAAAFANRVWAEADRMLEGDGP
jgi:hypothetical protein